MGSAVGQIEGLGVSVGRRGLRRNGNAWSEEQARLVWRNIGEVLAAAGMGISDIVQLNMLLTDRADGAGARTVRDEALGDHRPASTLMFVAGLARPEWLIEIDFIAARPM